MRRKWGPLIGGVLIGFILVAMNFKYTVTEDQIIYKSNAVYEQKSDKPLTGYVEVYFEGTDQLQSSTQYRKGLLNGKCFVYYENGQVRMKGKYKKNKQVGTWKVYNSEGKLITTIKYKNGREMSKEYHEYM